MSQPRHRGITSSILALVVVAGAGFLDYYIMQNGLPRTPDTANVVVMILTAWNGLAAAVVAYFFGSSASTDHQSQLLAESAPAQKTTATTANATITSQPADAPASSTP
jgi:hypothetical protein